MLSSESAAEGKMSYSRVDQINSSHEEARGHTYSCSEGFVSDVFEVDCDVVVRSKNSCF